MNNDIQNINDVIKSAFDNIKIEDVDNAVTMHQIWNKVLLRIKSNSNPNEGRNLAGHSKVVDYKNGIILVEADHPGWINILKMRNNYILRGMKMEIPDIQIDSIAYKLKGTRGFVEEKSMTDIELKKEIEKNMQKEEENLKKYDKEIDVSGEKELPPEILAIFEGLENS